MAMRTAGGYLSLQGNIRHEAFSHVHDRFSRRIRRPVVSRDPDLNADSSTDFTSTSPLNETKRIVV